AWGMKATLVTTQTFESMLVIHGQVIFQQLALAFGTPGYPGSTEDAGDSRHHARQRGNGSLGNTVRHGACIAAARETQYREHFDHAVDGDEQSKERTKGDTGGNQRIVLLDFQVHF